MTSLQLSIESNWRGNFAGAPDVGIVAQQISEMYRKTFTDGAGADQAQQYWADIMEVSGARSLDLAGGVTNVYGATVTFTAIKAIRVRAAATNAAAIVIGGAASLGFVGPFSDATDKIGVPPGGMFEIVNPSAGGWTVTAGTGDILLIAGTNGDDYTIELVGEG